MKILQGRPRHLAALAKTFYDTNADARCVCGSWRSYYIMVQKPMIKFNDNFRPPKSDPTKFGGITEQTPLIKFVLDFRHSYEFQTGNAFLAIFGTSENFWVRKSAKVLCLCVCFCFFLFFKAAQWAVTFFHGIVWQKFEKFGGLRSENLLPKKMKRNIGKEKRFCCLKRWRC